MANASCLPNRLLISNEALAVFVRFWLTGTPPLPDTALASARERYEGYVEALGAASRAVACSRTDSGGSAGSHGRTGYEHRLGVGLPTSSNTVAERSHGP
jgi:hypothetical protein